MVIATCPRAWNLGASRAVDVADGHHLLRVRPRRLRRPRVRRPGCISQRSSSHSAGDRPILARLRMNARRAAPAGRGDAQDLSPTTGRRPECVMRARVRVNGSRRGVRVLFARWAERCRELMVGGRMLHRAHLCGAQPGQACHRCTWFAELRDGAHCGACRLLERGCFFVRTLAQRAMWA